MLKLLNHPNVIEYYENFLEDKALMIAMEYAPGGKASLHWPEGLSPLGQPRFPLWRTENAGTWGSTPGSATVSLGGSGIPFLWSLVSPSVKWADQIASKVSHGSMMN